MDLVVTVDRRPLPGETVAGERFFTVPGGKGANQAIAASRAGASVTMIGAVGEDAYGTEMLALLDQAGVDRTYVRRAPVTTGTAHITVDPHGGNSIVVVPGANGTMIALSEEQRAVVSRADMCLLQLELPLSVVVETAEVAHAAGVTVVLTPAPVQPLSPSLLATVDLLVPNEGEARTLTGAGNADEAAAQLAARGPDVVVTLGERGSLYLGRAGYLRNDALPVRAVDTTAAGDTFVGALAARRGEGWQWQDALRWASAASALAVQRWGASASMPTRDEVDALLRQ
jgi:ribokinase